MVKSNRPRKRAAYARFRGWRRGWWRQKADLENEPCMLVFEGGGGGGLGKEQPPLKTSRVCSFSRWWWWQKAVLETSRVCSFSRVGVVVVLEISNCPRKRAYAARFQGWRWMWCWQGATALENEHARLVLRVEVGWCWPIAAAAGGEE